LTPDGFFGWWFEFGHVVPLETLKVGQKVKSGELIGYAEPVDGTAFDLQLWHSGKRLEYDKGIDSYINHATDALLAQYAKYGLTPENMIIPKAVRDAEPCLEFNKNPEEDVVNIGE